jgi:VCBS repeat-containing protein
MNAKMQVRLICCLAIAGCGGGGDEVTPPPPNSPPASLVSTPALLVVTEDMALNAQLSATDPNGDSLTYSGTTLPSHGTLTVSPAGAVTYTPAANYNGPDAFTATVSDNRGGSASAMFNVTVTAVNDAPAITGSTTLNFSEDQTATLELAIADPEGDTVGLELLANAAHGVVTIVGTGIQLQPDANFNGQDSVSVRAVDNHGAASAATTITLNVTAVNDAPLAQDDQGIAPATGSTLIDVRGNDSDIDGDALTISIVTPPGLGTATVVNNQLSYTPQAGFVGPQTLVYRATDPAGASADATLRLVVGSFPHVLFIEGDPRSRLYQFDGFTTTTINPNASYQTYNFSFSADGRRMIYNQRTTQSNSGALFLYDFAAPGQATELMIATRQFDGLRYALNRDGTYLLYSRHEISPPPNDIITRLMQLTAPWTQANVVTEVAPNIFPEAGVFNPVTDEFYFQGRISHAALPTPSSQAFDTVFASSIAAPAAVQIGASYPLDNGSGSGANLRVTTDGGNLVYVAFNHTTDVASLLVNNRDTNVETDLYRTFVAGEFPAPNEYDMNAAGSSVCFRINNPGAGSIGPGRVWVASPATPGAATAVTPLADYNFDCRFASDGDTIAYLTSDGGQPAEVHLVDRNAPNVITRMREPLTAGQSTEFFAVARDNMIGVVGINPAGGGGTVFYRVDLDSPGTSVRFATLTAVGSNAQYTLSSDGNWLAYLKDTPLPGGGTIKQLHLTSTQTPDFDITLGQGAATMFRFRPGT